VLSEPRIGFKDSLNAILIAELADNDAWNTLIAMAEEAGLKKEAGSFRRALQEEVEHLQIIRDIIEQAFVGSGAMEEREIA